MNWWVWRRRVHSSWLVAIASGGVLVGVVLSQYVGQSLFYSFVWVLCGMVVVLGGCYTQKLFAIPLVLLGGSLVGLWRGSIDQVQLNAYESLYGQTIELRGAVKEDVDEKNGLKTIRLGSVMMGDVSLPGMVWATTNSAIDIKRGDLVAVRAKLQTGFGNIAAALYRADVVQVQRPEPGDVARRMRDWFADAVRIAIPEPQASLGIGYLVGQRRALPEDLASALQIAGLTHIVVASGYNLTILVRLARRLFVKVSKYLSALAAGGMIVSFIAVTGMSPSMSRAGLVAGLSLVAWYYGRKFHPLVLLPFAAAVTVLFNPSYTWGDIGWQLSFAAFAGVMLLAPLLQRYFFGEAKPGFLRQILGETIAAQIATLPILLYTFGQFSNVALIANLLVLPLVPLAMLLTFLAGIGALALPAAALAIGLPATWLLGYMVWVAQLLAQVSWAQTEIAIGLWFVVGSYCALVGACVYMWRKTAYDLRNSNIVE